MAPDKQPIDVWWAFIALGLARAAERMESISVKQALALAVAIIGVMGSIIGVLLQVGFNANQTTLTEIKHGQVAIAGELNKFKDEQHKRDTSQDVCIQEIQTLIRNTHPNSVVTGGGHRK